MVDGNPLEDLAAIGANKAWFDAPDRSQDIPSLRIIMKDGKIYKNTLSTEDAPATAATQQDLNMRLAGNVKYPELHLCLHDHDGESTNSHRVITATYSIGE